MFGQIEISELSCYEDKDGLRITAKVLPAERWNARRSVEAACTWLRDDPKRRLMLRVDRPKRSADANAYCWTLLNRLGEVLAKPPEDLYRELIKEIGCREIIPVRQDAEKRFREVWENKGIGWLTERLSVSKLPGYVNIVCWYGSSVYSTEEMAKLIDLTVQECKQQGIETRPKEEIESMLAQWRTK